MAKKGKQRSTSRIRDIAMRMRKDPVFAQKMKDEYVDAFGKTKDTGDAKKDKVKGDAGIVARILTQAVRRGKPIKGYQGSGSGDETEGFEDDDDKKEGEETDKPDEGEEVKPKTSALGNPVKGRSKDRPESERKAAIAKYSERAAKGEDLFDDDDKKDDKKKTNENVDLEIASTYLQMLSESENSLLIENVITEMEDLLQEQFDDEEYTIMYEYIIHKLYEALSAEELFSKQKFKKDGQYKKILSNVKGPRDQNTFRDMRHPGVKPTPGLGGQQ